MTLHVSQNDIQKMHDMCHSGIHDIGTANAVSIALKRQLKAKYNPEVVFASNHDACRLRIGEESYSLPQNLYWWLRESQNGVDVKPSKFTFAVPEIMKKKKVRRAERFSESLSENQLCPGG